MAWKYGDRTLKVGKAWVDDETAATVEAAM